MRLVEESLEREAARGVRGTTGHVAEAAREGPGNNGFQAQESPAPAD